MVYPWMGRGTADSYSGMTYSYNKTFSKNLSFPVVYMDLQAKGYGGRDKELESAVTWSF
ncbi:hypothetical protein SPACI_053390 [Sporomusa acidovorans DSM 3132]|uniref:Uncharacterized protein n=2 Tax=Sporomusa TaxID=2375 RepID=A0ABZ3JB49_SPOA4|nr:hypothetical protein SPACI_17760 [Sporomusa acidovorans DSM 3132]SDD59728.1 hypothetical protein SAMN04488499_1002157 [Sporomusa acidovorans]